MHLFTYLQKITQVEIRTLLVGRILLSQAVGDSTELETKTWISKILIFPSIQKLYREESYADTPADNMAFSWCLHSLLCLNNEGKRNNINTE